MSSSKFYAIMSTINSNYNKPNLVEFILQVFDISIEELKQAFKLYLLIDFDTYIFRLNQLIEIETNDVEQDEPKYEEIQNDNNSVHDHITEILEYIDSKLYCVTARDIVTHFRLNPYQFGVLFQREINMTLQEYTLSVKKQINSNFDTVIVDTVIDYICSNVSTVTVEEIMRVFNASLKYLNSIFYYYLGTYIRDYIYYRKVILAGKIIMNTNASDDKITISLGFGCPATFTYHFQKVYNCTPREYRNLRNRNPHYNTVKGKKVLVVDMKQGK